MLTQIKGKRSLTFYQSTAPNADLSSTLLQGLYAVPLSAQVASTTSIAGSIAGKTAEAINSINSSTAFTIAGNNKQLSAYLRYIVKTQNELTQQTQSYVSAELSKNPAAKATQLRDRKNWSKVKEFVVRQELMKRQFGGKADIPVSVKPMDEISIQIQGKDLTTSSDEKVKDIISGILKPQSNYADEYLHVLKDFQTSGKVSELLQKDKLDELTRVLKDVDLSKLTKKQYKSLVKNFCEVNEGHHGESISSDPYAQSESDNIVILSTSEHKEAHNNGNFKKPVKAPPLDRKGELKSLNQKRNNEVKRNAEKAIKHTRTEGRKQLLQNELKGVAAAAAIGLLAGFTIGFSASLAQNGLSPDSFKQAFLAGSKSSVVVGGQSIIGYGVGRTLGVAATKALTGVLNNAGVVITERISEMCNMASVGVITIILSCAYQFISLVHQGIPMKKVATLVGKQALVSLSLLGVAVAAQGIWGGPAGLIVSISSGIIVIVYSTADMIHQRQISEKIRVYLIEKCRPMVFQSA